MSRFHNATAVIVGGSKGIGFRLAEHLLAAGGRVVITARDGNALNRGAEGLGGPDRVLAVAGSTVDPAHRQAVVSGALEQFGSLDHLVVNAAAAYGGTRSEPFGGGPIAAASPEAFDVRIVKQKLLLLLELPLFFPKLLCGALVEPLEVL